VKLVYDVLKRYVKPREFFLTHTQALLLPIRVLTNPRDTYNRLRATVRKAPVTVKAIANIYAYIVFSLTSAFLILLAGFLYSMYNMATLNISGAFGGFAHAVIAAFIYPIFIAIALGLLDTVLIILPAKLLEKDTPDYLGILLIRTSSLIGYAVKPALIALFHGPSSLSIVEIYKLHLSGSMAWISISVTLLTYALTVYGLVKSGGLRRSVAAISAGVPVIAHILV
jgi:hypothetical protein